MSLIEAYTQLPKNLTNEYSLLIVGASGWLNSSIKEKIIDARLKGYKILRPQDYVVDKDLPAIYSGASILAYPSHYEGFGLPILEAMACGVPVIAGNNSSMPEVGATAALYADANSPKDIAAKIQKVLTDKDLQKKLSKLGLDRANHYSWEKSAQQLVEICQELGSK